MRRTRVALFAVLALFFMGLLGVSACSFSNEADDTAGDPPIPITDASALGNGARISNLAPTTEPDGAPNKNHPAPDASIYVTGASLIVIDQYDETMNGKSIGSVYVQDVASQRPYSGLQIYRPTYTPANLLLAPGDVVDFTGTYQDYAYTSFSPFQTTPEAYEPIVTFRFEYRVPAPTVIPVSDLAAVTPQAAYEKGQQWLSMLVEIDDVTITAMYADTEGRVSLYPTTDTLSTAPGIANQLFALDPTMYGCPPASPGNTVACKGMHLSKIIGVCNFFFNFTISPRTPADLVP
jgi:hypothetical protein